MSSSEIVLQNMMTDMKTDDDVTAVHHRLDGFTAEGGDINKLIKIESDDS